MVSLGVVAERVLEEGIVNQMRELLLKQIEVVKSTVTERQDSWQSILYMDELADRLGSKLMVRVTFISPQGKVVGDSHVETADLARLETHARRPEVKEALQKGTGWDIRYSNTVGVDLFYLASLCGAREGSQLVIRLAVPAGGIFQAKARLKAQMGGIFLLGLAVLFLAGRSLGKKLSEWRNEVSRDNLEALWGELLSGEESPVEPGVHNIKVKLRESISTLREAKDRLEAVLHGMVEGVMLLDPKGRIQIVNSALGALLEARVDPVGRSPAEAYRLPGLQEAVEECIGDRRARLLEIKSKGATGKVLEVQVSPTPQGGAVALFRDVTEKKRLEEMRKNLIANVSHELRTPLTAIRGAVEGLMDELPEGLQQTQRFANMIHRQVLRLEKMVKDLLDLSKLEAEGRLSESKIVEAREIAREAMESVKEMAEAKGLELQSSFTSAQAHVRGNPRELEQALVNLLTNAIQFTERGRVVLRVEAVGNEVHFSVEDTGVGIPEEHLPRIFERFYRVDRDRSREKGGSGLGLSIVKHIVQNHGGRVEVQSTPGQGSIFRVILPRSGGEEDSKL